MEEFREFTEYENPLGNNYDIKSARRNVDPKEEARKEKLNNELIEVLGGYLEDITEQELIESYGITMHEYLNPSEDTIEKVKSHLGSGRH